MCALLKKTRETLPEIIYRLKMHSRIVQQQNEQNERFSLHSVCGRTGRFGQKRESFKYVQRRGTVHTRGHAVGYADGHTVGHMQTDKPSDIPSDARSLCAAVSMQVPASIRS